MATPKPGSFKLKNRDEKYPLQKMGLPPQLEGRNPTGLGGSDGVGLGDALAPIIEGIRNRKMCTMLVMPNVEEADLILDGPQSDANVKLSFGTKIDPFGFGPTPAINGSFETTLAQPSQTQTHMIVCAVGWHLRPEPLCFTATGNSVVRPAASAAQPPSPDTYTALDIANGALPAAITYTPAEYEHGWWANYVCWQMVKAYNLRWQMGQNLNIFNDSLRNTAFMPSSAQDGSASSSLVDVPWFVNQLNAYYQGVAPGCQEFLRVDCVRLGSVGTGGANLGQFTPSRDLERVEATYGGMGLRELLKGNSEFRALSTPYVLGAGIPIGLYADEANVDMAGTMRQYLSITNGLGGVPPAVFNDDPTIFAGTNTLGGTTVTQERTLDGSSQAQTYPASRAVFKGGRLLIEVKIKGFEISEDLHTLMKINSKARDMICSECGIAWGLSRS
jgi:hypothetical protein